MKNRQTLRMDVDKAYDEACLRGSAEAWRDFFVVQRAYFQACGYQTREPV
ncbi:hypothetical protein [Roseomonas sp. WA12]